MRLTLVSDPNEAHAELIASGYYFLPIHLQEWKKTISWLLDKKQSHLLNTVNKMNSPHAADGLEINILHDTIYFILLQPNCDLPF